MTGQELSGKSSVEPSKAERGATVGTKGPRRAGPCKGVAAPSQPGTHRPPGRGNSRALADFLRVTAVSVQMLALLELEHRVMILKAFPWINDLHWRLTCRIHELREDEQRLLKARAVIRGEEYRRVHIQPPTRLVAPSEQINRAAAGFARAISLVKGE